MKKSFDVEEKIIIALIGLGLFVTVMLGMRVMEQRSADAAPTADVPAVTELPGGLPDRPDRPDGPAESNGVTSDGAAPATTAPETAAPEAQEAAEESAPAAAATGVNALAGDVAAQQQLRAVGLVAQGHHADQGDFVITAAEATVAVPGLTAVDNPAAAGPGVLGIGAGASEAVFVIQAESGLWYCVAVDEAATVGGTSPTLDAVMTVSGCKSNEGGWGVLG